MCVDIATTADSPEPDVKVRSINFRAFIFIFIVAMIAVFCATLSFRNPLFGLILFFIIVVQLIIATIVYLKLKYSLIKALTCTISLVVFVFAFLSFIITVNTWNELGANGVEYFHISGEIDSIHENDKTYEFVIKNISSGDKRLKGKASLYLSKTNETNNYSLTVEGFGFSGYIKLETTVKRSQINYNRLSTNTRYIGHITENNFSIIQENPKALSRFNTRIKLLLMNNIGNDLGGLAYGMLSGNESYISDKMLDDFSTSGLGHLLAVSGLHVGFIATMLMWITKKLKVRQIFSFIIITAFFIFYMIFANFSTSIIRAVIMFEVLLASRLLGMWYDSLSSLCFACTLILIIFPYSLFCASFVFSAGAVYALILFTKPIEDLFGKTRLPKFLVKSLSPSISVQFGVIPCTIFYFSQIQVYSIFINVFLMYVIMLTFSALFVFVTLCLILPFLSFLIKASSVGLVIISVGAELTASLPYALVLYESIGVLTCFGCYFFLSRFYFPKVKFDFIKLSSFVFTLIFLFNGIFFTPKLHKKTDLIIPINYLSSVSSIVKSGDSTYLIGDCDSFYSINKTINDFGIRRLDAIFLNSITQSSIKTAERISKRFKAEKVFIPYQSLNDISMLGQIDNDSFELVKDTFAYKEIKIIVIDNVFYGYSFENLYVNALFLNGFPKVIPSEVINTHAIIRCISFNGNYVDRIYLTNFLDDSNDSPDANFSLVRMSDFAFDFANGVTLIY